MAALGAASARFLIANVSEPNSGWRAARALGELRRVALCNARNVEKRAHKQVLPKVLACLSGAVEDRRSLCTAAAHRERTPPQIGASRFTRATLRPL